MSSNVSGPVGERNKVMAMHQPNYLPWLGYFYKMARCEVFVYLDVVQYPRGRSFASRNRIKTPNGAVYLTIPVRIPEGRQGRVKYTEVLFANNQWREKHLKTVALNYKRAPYFEEVFERYRKVLLESREFVELNIRLIETFATYLGITSKRVRLSDILRNFGQKTDLIVDICKVLETTVYLSGTGGGRDYNDRAMLKEKGIQLLYSDFEHPLYPQLWGPFESHLSVLDVLFNCGPDSRRFL